MHLEKQSDYNVQFQNYFHCFTSYLGYLEKVEGIATWRSERTEQGGRSLEMPLKSEGIAAKLL